MNMPKNPYCKKTHSSPMHSKLPELLKDIPPSAFDSSGIKTIEYLLNYFSKSHDPLLSSRIFLFYGHAGVGKTYLVQQLLSLIGKEIVYIGCEKITGDHLISCKSLEETITAISNPESPSSMVGFFTIIPSRITIDHSPLDAYFRCTNCATIGN